LSGQQCHRKRNLTPTALLGIRITVKLGVGEVLTRSMQRMHVIWQ
jgi:hypothetical protein